MFEETFAQAWEQRFGAAPDFDLPEIARLLTHRSVRKYSDKPVTRETIRALVGAAQSAATSSNLQLWSVITIQDPERRAKITELCDNQSQVREAPVYFTFFADHYRLKKAAAAVGANGEGLDYAEFLIMAMVDAALAAERLVCAAETLGLGICYIGGLRNDVNGVRTLLNLPEGVFGVFGLCVGYPAEDAGAEIKPRLSPETVWFEEQYNQDVTVAEYDERMTGFYEAQKMKGSVTWSMRSGRRIDGQHMTGREILKAWLEDQGMGRR